MFHVLADRPSIRRSIRVAAFVTATLIPAGARADVEWHPDLATAHAASRISRRPVLAVFVATWGEGAARLEETCLRSPEAEAVLAACFEPVRIDIDEHAALTRSANVTHVPTACVLGADDAALTSFELPATPPAFVTAAILAAREATELEHGGAAGGIPATDAPIAALGDAATPASRPARGSIARVTAKVRDLSAFAAGTSQPTTSPTPVAIDRSPQVAGPQPPQYALMSWPAESAVAAPGTAACAPAIEPAATPAPTMPSQTTTAPWLDSAAAATSPLPPAAQPAPQPTPSQSGLIATLQKPFTVFGKPAVEPPTVAPALPRGPLAGLVPPAAAQPQVAPPAAVQPAPHDAGGPMPLGLEGYCPVTLVDRGTWTEGRAQWGARHRGRTYLFAGPEEQRMFLSDPDRYAPALSGDDPVLALDRGASTPGQRRYGVTYQARMYLFATPETRSAFSADPARYATRIALAERPAAAGAAATRTY